MTSSDELLEEDIFQNMTIEEIKDWMGYYDTPTHNSVANKTFIFTEEKIFNDEDTLPF